MHLLKNALVFTALSFINTSSNASDRNSNPQNVNQHKSIQLKIESEASPGQLNESWAIEGKNTSVSLKIDTRPSSKDKILALKNDRDGQTISLAQEVDAKAWRGKIVEICGDLKASFNKASKSGIWIRTDIPSNSLRVAATYSLPLRTSWQRTCASIAVDRAANRLGFGADSNIKGEIWVANLELHEVGNIGEPNITDPGSRALSAVELENLRGLSKAIGYIRYFHATDALVKLDWNKFMQKAVPAVEIARSDTELANTLKSLFTPYAPTTQWLTSVEIPQKILQPEDANFQVKWIHHGLAQRDYFYHSDRVYEQLSKNFNSDVSMKTNVVQLKKIELGRQVALWMPDLVFSNNDHETIPKVEPDNSLNKADYQLKNIAPEFSGNDRITRIGNAIQVWNALRYFYPYSDIIKIDWDRELDALLLSASSDQDEKAFTHTLMRFTSALQDGHSRVTGPRELDNFSPLIKIKMIDGLPKVARSHQTSRKQPLIPFGSEITHINGLPVAHRLLEINRENFSATDAMQAEILSVELLSGRENSQVEISYRNDRGLKQTKTFLRDTPIASLGEENPLRQIQQMRSGIWYVDIDRASNEDIKKFITQKNNIKGIIFDVRNYVNSTPSTLLSHFTKKPLNIPIFNVPIVNGPDRDNWRWERIGRVIKPQSPYINPKLVFLVSGNTISAAETLMTIVEHHKLGEIIGSPTAGTNGNITCLPLPGGYKVFWTGMQVLKPDGSRFHGVGIIPTVPYKFTTEDAISGHDVVLEKAIKLLTEK